MNRPYADANKSGSAFALCLQAADLASRDGNFMMPSLEQVLKEIGPLPQEALFLGQAEDDLPVLLDMHDPAPGPVLLVGCERFGRTLFLRCIARFVVTTHEPHQIQFGVITSHVEEWPNTLIDSPHCVGVFASHQSSARQFVQSLEMWLHQSQVPSQSVLLLVDCLDELLGWDERTLAGLREILTHGPHKRVWPIMTLDSACYLAVDAWLRYFRTQLLQVGLELDHVEGTTQVHPGTRRSQIFDPFFILRTQVEWIRFWIPE